MNKKRQITVKEYKGDDRCCLVCLKDKAEEMFSVNISNYEITLCDEHLTELWNQIIDVGIKNKDRV